MMLARTALPRYIFARNTCLIRAASSLSTSQQQQPLVPPKWVSYLNSAIALAPRVTFTSFIVLDAATMYLIFGVYTATGLVVDPTFLAAFGASRLLRRARLPIDLAVAGFLKSTFPSLSQVHMSALFGKPSSSKSWYSSVLEASRVGADTYGLSYLISARCICSLASVSTLYFAIGAGIDVPAALDALYLSISTIWGGGGEGATPMTPATAEAVTKMTDVIGRWSAAAVSASPLFPLSVLGAGVVGNTYGKNKDIFSSSSSFSSK